MKLIFTLVFVFSTIVGLTVGLKQFGQNCEVEPTQSENACDEALGLYCSSPLKVCHCKSINGTSGAANVSLVWSHGECRIKVHDICQIKSESSSSNETHAENTSPAPLAAYHCIHRAECLNGTCQCIKGYHSSQDLTACKNGASTISGIHLFVFFVIGLLIVKEL